ncbi:MAG: bifunctional folylpolyglutamate synthase/dihydrofolate synthase [Chloroflexota bacterium]
MNYRQALQAIHDRSDYDRGFITNPFAGDDAAALGLRRTRALLDALGAPDGGLKIVHIAGTKGKGSTCAFLESVARHAGLSTGLYTTPHLHSFRERIQINGEPISEREFADITENVLSKADDVARNAGYPTAFEIVTAMAVLAFSHHRVDIAILEVGLGGRLDATNVVDPAVSVITRVSYDHQRILGETLSEIAGEKAGIIKPDVPVVVAPQAHEAEQVILDVARERGAPVYGGGRDWNVMYHESIANLTGPWGTIANVRLGLTGEHQAINAGAALMSAWVAIPEALRNLDTVRGALEATTWPGRFEVVCDDGPVTVIDGAHNVESIEVLIDTVSECFPNHRCTFIFGTSDDKDARGMLTAIARCAEKVIVTASRNPRAANPDDLLLAARELGLDATKSRSIQDAIAMARSERAHDDVLVITGSLYVVAEGREAVGLGTTPRVEREVFSP